MRVQRLLVTLTTMLLIPATAHSQSPYSHLMGSWKMDSTNGPDDNGLPKSETLVFAPAAGGFHLTATEDNGQGPNASTFDCTPAGAMVTSGSTTMKCTIQPMRDSVRYAVDVQQNGKVVATERGRLIVSADGHGMRDEYDASDGTHPPTHHRHIYAKSS